MRARLPRSKIGGQAQIAGRKDSHVQHNTTHLIRFLALALAAVAALLVPSVASAASSGGAVVFSRVVTKTVTETVKDAEGKPVKDAEGKEETKVKTTVEGGLFAVKDGHLNQLTEDPTDTEPSFSPDSRAIVFSRAGDIFSVRADGSGLRRVTSGAEIDTAPSVAPNGRYVLFERRANEGAPADLYTVSLNGGATKALTSSADDDHEASFSADGKLIVFVHSVAETGGGTADDLYSVRPNGAGLTRLTKTGRVDEWDPRYFAGGIVYSRGQSGEDASAFADIYTMRRDGRKAKALVAGAGSAYVEDVSPDGHTLIFRRDQGLWVKRIGPAAPGQAEPAARRLADQLGLLLGRQARRRLRRGGRAHAAARRSTSPTAPPTSSPKASCPIGKHPDERHGHDARPGHHLAAEPLAP